MQNIDKKYPLDLTTSEEIKALIQKNIDILKGVDNFLPPKPPCIQGYLYSLCSMKFLNKKRFFVLNPDHGTFIRY